MTFSRRSIHSHRASSSTCILFKLGIALKSKLSRLLTVGSSPWCRHRSEAHGGRRLDPALDHPALAVDQFELHQPGEELHMILPLGGALAGELGVFPEERRQLQRLEMVVEQQLRGVAHAGPPTRHM